MKLFIKKKKKTNIWNLTIFEGIFSCINVSLQVSLTLIINDVLSSSSRSSCWRQSPCYIWYIVERFSFLLVNKSTITLIIICNIKKKQVQSIVCVIHINNVTSQQVSKILSSSSPHSTLQTLQIAYNNANSTPCQQKDFELLHCRWYRHRLREPARPYRRSKEMCLAPCCRQRAAAMP